MKNGNVVEWKNSGGIGIVVKIAGDYAKLRYNLIEDDHIKRKISDWIHQSELIIIEE